MRAQPNPRLKLIVQSRPRARAIRSAHFLDRGSNNTRIPLHRSSECRGSISGFDIIGILPGTPADFDHGSGPIYGFGHAAEIGGGTEARQ